MSNCATMENSKLEMKFAKKGLGWGGFSGAVWGLDGVLLGIALSMAPFAGGSSLFLAPLVGAALHDGIAAFWLLLLNVYSGKLREIPRALATKPGRIVCLSALIGGPVGMTGYLLGIAHAGAAYAMSISAVYPAVGSILAVIILKERTSPRAWIGITISMIGAIIVGYTQPDVQNFPHFYLGLSLALLAAVGWGFESVLSTYGMDVLDPDVTINIRQIVSFSTYAVIALPLVRGYSLLSQVAVSKAGLVMAASGLCGALSYWSWYKALNMTGVGRAMALSITYALWGILYGVILTDLKITQNLIVGAVVIFIGTLLVVAKPGELLNLRNTGEDYTSDEI